MVIENSDMCGACGGKGWLHMDEPYEIERCDTCKKFDADDEAQEAHRDECKCGWPEVDWPSAFCSWTESIRASWEPAANAAIEELEGLVDCRGQKFIDNINLVEEHLSYMMGAKYSWQGLEEKSVTQLGGKVKAFLEIVTEVREGLERDEIATKDFGDPPPPKTPSIKENMTAQELIDAAMFRSEQLKEGGIFEDLVINTAIDFAKDMLKDEDPGRAMEFLIDRLGASVARDLVFTDFRCTDKGCPDAETFHDHPKED